MVKDLIYGVAAALRSQYNENDYRVYTESVPQDLQAPAFFIRLKKQELFPGLGRRFREDDLLEVGYVPASVLEPLAECQGVAEALEFLLASVETESGLVYGEERKGRIEEGRLFFEVRYRSYWYREADPDALMQEVTVYDRKGAAESGD